MTSYELAHKLLAGPDLPVVTSVNCDGDSVSGVRNVRVSPGSYTKDREYVCRGPRWEDSQNPEPTHVFVEAKADCEFQAEVFEQE